MNNSTDQKTPDPDDDVTPGMLNRYISEIGKDIEAEKKRQRRAQQKQTSVAGLRKTFRGKAVLFYPACFTDWSIIRDLSNQCNTFVYSDWYSTTEHVAEAMVHGPAENPAPGALRSSPNEGIDIPIQRLIHTPLLPRPSFLMPEEIDRYTVNFTRFANQRPWCRRYAATVSTGEDQERKLDLIYLGVEGVNAYWELFNRHGTAPKYLCINNCGDGFGYNYTAFYRWEEPLGRAVLEGWKQHGHAPTFLITDRTDCNWPWTKVVGHAAGATVYALPDKLTLQEADEVGRKRGDAVRLTANHAAKG